MIALLKPIRRKTTGRFMHYGTPIVVELKPGDVLAAIFYQDFKWSAIAPLQKDNWNLTSLEIETLVRELWRKNANHYESRIDRRLEDLAFEVACNELSRLEEATEIKFNARQAHLKKNYSKIAADLLGEVLS
jgi:hypothetical protein